MQRKICKMCDRFYETEDTHSCFCPSCEEDRQLCLEYLERNPRASIIEITMGTNIPIKRIKKLIDDDLLGQV